MGVAAAPSAVAAAAGVTLGLLANSTGASMAACVPELRLDGGVWGTCRSRLRRASLLPQLQRRGMVMGRGREPAKGGGEGAECGALDVRLCKAARQCALANPLTAHAQATGHTVLPARTLHVRGPLVRPTCQTVRPCAALRDRPGPRNRPHARPLLLLLRRWQAKQAPPQRPLLLRCTPAAPRHRRLPAAAPAGCTRRARAAPRPRAPEAVRVRRARPRQVLHHAAHHALLRGGGAAGGRGGRGPQAVAARTPPLAVRLRTPAGTTTAPC